jgi:hypothetical protein
MKQAAVPRFIERRQWRVLGGTFIHQTTAFLANFLPEMKKIATNPM